ncbi:uncharacterized protein TNIN_101031 [Trichonephila inaurata madagascariensis]|uniref:WKF domain-containing protein n=1 Tax=Trichonephila inaurata madagascariensis TaxID=2747483 RepID=A0A8X6Y8F6_9ARAC|nr:uncharacterized protein TNIN_101031 [Trichonephila inaurata madagascariensis]
MKPESEIATNVRSFISSKSKLYTQDKADTFWEEDEIQEEKQVDTNPKRKATEADQERKGEKKRLKKKQKIEDMLSSVKKDISGEENEVQEDEQVDTKPKHKSKGLRSTRSKRRLKKKLKIQEKLRSVKKDTFWNKDEVLEEKQVNTNLKLQATEADQEPKRKKKRLKKQKIEARFSSIKKDIFRDEDEVQEEKQVDTMPKRKATEADQERKREKRRLKKQQLIEARLRSVQKDTAVAKAEAINYLHLWNSSRELWHFKKKQQHWLLKKAFDTDSISDSDFEILLEYILELKGVAKSRLMEESEKILKLHEEKDENSDSISIDPAFDRARSIMQMI